MALEHKRILVTGGAGFIGSHLVRKLLAKTDSTVINLDKLTYAADLQELKACENSPRYVFEQVDICDPYRIRQVLDTYEPDAVFHLAAESHVDRSIAGPEVFIQSNIVGTFHLLEACRGFLNSQSKSKSNKFRFVFVSTDEVYGSLSIDDQPCHEDSPFAPRSPYSASKASADHLVSAWVETYGLPAITTRCSNNFGAGQFPEKLIPVVIQNAIQNRTIPVYGTGENIRDWIYVEDHVNALLTVLEKGSVGACYHIASGNELSNLALVHLICEILDVKSPSNSGDYSNLIQLVNDRPGHDFRYALDTSRIQSELGWRCETPLKAGLEITVEWYLNRFMST